MNTAFTLLKSETKLQEIRSGLDGYWENDIWDIKSQSFKDIIGNTSTGGMRYINFKTFPFKLRDEMKFYILYRLKSKEIEPYTIIKDYCTPFKQVADFYDIRDEYEKDIWDIRIIAPSKVLEHVSHYRLNFTEIPQPFINVVKRYIKFRLSYLSHGQCRTDIMGIQLFLKFINSRYPRWNNLTLLTRKDIEDYMAWYNSYTEGYKASKKGYLIALHRFLENIQRLDYIEAPEKPVSMLIFREDWPRNVKTSESNIKYIPESVLIQLENNLEYLTPSEYLPIVILLRASGWRISDILNLKYDTCLESTAQGWYLCGDILKTQVLNHRVPITDEIASFLNSIVETIKIRSSIDNNPNKLLFAKLNGKRKGHPPNASKISQSLNRLAIQKNIIDGKGTVFHFRNHAFRHTKAIELINNGMNLLHVQKWMAHASPEMTLIYARLLDETMRKSWEEATKQGLFRIDQQGNLKSINITDIENEDVIEWEYIRHNLDAVRMPLGYCMKPKKQECYTQLNPCLTCRNLCTTPDFIPQYELEIKETKAVIERGITQNRSVWVEKNQALLERYESILAILKGGKTHHKAGKKGREYIGEERNNG
ncbi:MAG: tyrosine-type recombinase/integrase [Ruminiclostridium sp.]